MNRSTRFCHVLPAALLLSAASLCPAALPIDALKKMQAAAPDQMDVHIQKVKTEARRGDRDFLTIFVEAQVRAVRRSAAGLKVGADVLIVWRIPRPDVDFAGDWAEPPKARRTYRAYLEAGAKVAVPAAASASFELIPFAAVSGKNKAVKVFILAGQSNMEGHGVISGKPGQKGTLQTLAQDPATAARYKHLRDKGGKWIVRDDVWITWYDNKGPLAVGGFAGRGSIGPELGFGWAVGDYLDQPVLLLKFGPGGTSLAGPWRPPSSGENGDKPRGPGVGDQYDNLIASVKKQLKNLDADFPKLAGRGYELAGFAWHQGWNDGCSMTDTQAYEGNMANFIRDVRKDLGAPKLPFVIGGSGFGGWGQKVNRRLMIMAAQEAVAASDEFKKDTKYVETRPFFRDGPVSPRPIRYHWCCNAESYWLIGDGMGRAMVELLGGPKAPANPTGPTPN